jgi:hypothetical protein
MAKLYVDNNERGSNVDTLLLFMCVMTIQIWTGHVTARYVSVVVLTNYVVDLTIPKSKTSHMKIR